MDIFVVPVSVKVEKSDFVIRRIETLSLPHNRA